MSKISAITIKSTGGIGLPRRELQRHEKLTMSRVARKWHKDNAARHFTTSGARRYDYGRRRTKNVRTGQVFKTRRGRPRAPSGLPLVWTGNTRTRAKVVFVRATSKRSSASMPIGKLNFRPPGNPGLNMADEMKRVTRPERDKLRRFAVRDVATRLRRSRYTTTIRI